MGIREKQVQIEEMKEKKQKLPVILVAFALLLVLASGILYLQKSHLDGRILSLTKIVEEKKVLMSEGDQVYLSLKEEYQEVTDRVQKKEREGLNLNYLNVDGSKNRLYQNALGYYGMESAFRYYLNETYTSYFDEFPEVIYSKVIDGNFYYAVLKDEKRTMSFIYEIIFPVELVSFQVLEETVIQEE